MITKTQERAEAERVGKIALQRWMDAYMAACDAASAADAAARAFEAAEPGAGEHWARHAERFRNVINNELHPTTK